jgi:imidazolonepropionase-like amidohydrolase
LYEDVLRLGRYEPAIGTVERGWFENRSYIVLDTDADVETKWPVITSGRPDFLKVYLVHSEDDDATGKSGHSPQRSGLHPRLVAQIVAKAHAAGLQVTAHVETAADFRHAIRAGVDEIAHVPGWLVNSAADAESARLTEADARLALERHVRVVTTAVAGSAMPSVTGHHPHGHYEGHATGPSDHHATAPDESLSQVLKDNIALLHRVGVRVVVGSDHAETSLAEVMQLGRFHLFDNLTLLKMWCEDTPASIFPDRRIGRFDEGYEASFVALAGNPVEDFSQVQRIVRRFKQGVNLDRSFRHDAAPSGAGHRAH